MAVLPGTRATRSLKKPFSMKNSDRSFTCVCMYLLYGQLTEKS